MRLLICAGGTGGGVYPALVVRNALASEHADVETLWVGGKGGMEEALVKRAGIPFRAIPAAGLHGVGLRALPGNLLQLGRGMLAASKILREFRPDALFFTGGYVAGPVALAGRKIPTVLYVPDIEPGMALKALARFADRITVTAPDSQAYFDKPVHVTGYPLRADIMAWKREEARSALKLGSDKPVLLVTGGSKGARSINNVVLAHLPELLELAEIVHISGQLDWKTVQKAEAGLSSEQRQRYHIFPYLHEEMGAALAAADLAISRAGASSIGEYPFFGLPAVLVPYPYAWRYQKVNADYLTRHGAAVLLEDQRLEADLLTVVKGLLQNPEKLAAMRKAMRRLSKPGAAQAIVRQIVELAGEKSS
ncbi:MAG: UDP-N-acetylglucosamine--N-acetylmuramyl-(pentapeptide) pyrophosphoryl-undecaprenol N-acetylglucosamine transferase [Anaerolineales bacterium]